MAEALFQTPPVGTRFSHDGRVYTIESADTILCEELTLTDGIKRETMSYTPAIIVKGTGAEAEAKFSALTMSADNIEDIVLPPVPPASEVCTFYVPDILFAVIKPYLQDILTKMGITDKIDGHSYKYLEMLLEKHFEHRSFLHWGVRYVWHFVHHEDIMYFQVLKVGKMFKDKLTFRDNIEEIKKLPGIHRPIGKGIKTVKKYVDMLSNVGLSKPQNLTYYNYYSMIHFMDDDSDRSKIRGRVHDGKYTLYYRVISDETETTTAYVVDGLLQINRSIYDGGITDALE